MKQKSAAIFFTMSFMTIPSLVHASGIAAPVRDFSFLWSSPYWSLSALSLILLWIVLIILDAGRHKDASMGSTSALPEMKSVPPPSVSGPTTQFYTVRRGDSLASIARQFNTTREAIISLNAMQPPHRLKLGQQIKVTSSAPSASRSMDPITSHKEPLELPWSKDERGEDPREFQKPGGFSMWFKAFLGLTLAMVIVLGVLLFWVSQSTKKQEVPAVNTANTFVPKPREQHATSSQPEVIKPETATTTPVQQEEPQPVPVSVLNGGGAPGAAKKLADLMKTEGFEIATVGNADKYTYQTTEVRYHPKDRLWAGVVESWLRLKGYEVVMVEKESFNNVVEVVIGKK